MDISQFLDVSCDVGDEPLENLTEDDIVLLDDTPLAVPGAKRGHSGGPKAPPAKRVRPNKKPSANLKNLGIKKAVLSQQAMGILNNANLTVKKVAATPQTKPAPRPVPKVGYTYGHLNT